MLRHSILLPFACLFALSALSSCSSSTSPSTSAKLSVPDTVYFAAVRAGMSHDTAITFVSNGSDALQITKQTFSSPVFSLADTSQQQLNIAAGGSASVKIRFSPSDSGMFTGTDQIQSNAGTNS